MQKIEINGRELAYIDVGEGPETVVLSHCYLLDHRHYAPQIEVLKRRFRVLAYDQRDHGQSDLADGPYTLEDIYADGLGFIEAMGVGPCHFVGLSTGGFVGLRLAIRRPDLVKRLVLMDTDAGTESWRTKLRNEGMYLVLRTLGIAPLMGPVLPLVFGPTFRADPAARAEVRRWVDHLKGRDRAAMIRFGRAVFERDSVLPELGAIDAPTLVVVGEDDRTTPPRRARRMVDGIRGAELLVVPKAGHLTTLENPEVVNEALERFLA